MIQQSAELGKCFACDHCTTNKIGRNNILPTQLLTYSFCINLLEYRIWDKCALCMTVVTYGTVCDSKNLSITLTTQPNPMLCQEWGKI